MYICEPMSDSLEVYNITIHTHTHARTHARTHTHTQPAPLPTAYTITFMHTLMCF